MNCINSKNQRNENGKNSELIKQNLTDIETDFETDSEKKMKFSEFISENYSEKNLDESLSKALLKLYDELHFISDQQFYTFLIDEIGVDMKIVYLINLMKKGNLSKKQC